MEFKNHTPFPATAWKNFDKNAHLFLSTVVRVKYLFDTVDSKGHWRLKLDPDQGSLRGKDEHYEILAHNTEASIRFENDYMPYKPCADFVVNAFAHSTEPLKEWRCGVKVLRPSENSNQEETLLLEKWLRVRGTRHILEGVVGDSFTSSKKSTKVPIRYEYSNGGSIVNPKYVENEHRHKPYIKYAPYNPIGVGVTHKYLFEQEGVFRAPQIEAMDMPIDKPNMPTPPEGFGFLGVGWEPRLALAGTYDAKWLETKAPVLPDDFQDAFYNTAHPDMQLKGYFQPKDKIVLHNLVKDRYVQSFEIPHFYFKSEHIDVFSSAPMYLNIDTVVVDILEDEMEKNAVYITYRNHMPISKELSKTKLTMLVPTDFIGGQDGN